MNAVCRGTASTSFFQFQTALYWAKSRRATIYGTRQAQSPPAGSPNKSLHNRHNARLRRRSRKRAAQSCHGDAAVVAHTLAPRPRRDAGRRRRHRCEPARRRRSICFREEMMTRNDGEQAKSPTARNSALSCARMKRLPANPASAPKPVWPYGNIGQNCQNGTIEGTPIDCLRLFSGRKLREKSVTCGGRGVRRCSPAFAASMAVWAMVGASPLPSRK